MASTFTGFEPYQLLAHHLGFACINCQLYERGEPVKAPNNRQVGYPYKFTVTRKDGRKLHFVTAVEWEGILPKSLSGVLAEALSGERTYREKDQREYIMRMLRECQSPSPIPKNSQAFP